MQKEELQKNSEFCMGIEPMTFILPKLGQFLSSWFLETPLCVSQNNTEYPSCLIITLSFKMSGIISMNVFFPMRFERLRFYISVSYNCALSFRPCNDMGALKLINPLSPNSDQHQFSPHDIHTISRD